MTKGPKGIIMTEAEMKERIFELEDALEASYRECEKLQLELRSLSHLTDVYGKRLSERAQRTKKKFLSLKV